MSAIPSTVSIDDRDGVRLMTLDRPDALNAFNGQLFDDLTDAFIEADRDDGVPRSRHSVSPLRSPGSR